MNPIKRALAKPTQTAMGTGMSWKNMRFAVKHPVKATTDPTERSKTPEINSIIIPTATMVSVERFRSIWRRFSNVGKVEGKIILAQTTVAISKILKE